MIILVNEMRYIGKELDLFSQATHWTLENVRDYEDFDTILYVDVLEHIKEDKLQLEHASKFLRHKGVLIVLAPAHQWLYSPFDKSIGHFRRYTKQGLRDIVPANMQPLFLGYLDSCGMIASLVNKIFLRNELPSKAQIVFWDRAMVRVSIILDRTLCLTIGKSVLGIWKKG